ncbi:MAG: phosphotransferase family protein [Dehalococcoidia bacterium]|nr:phosphotransferase family protein [Dehalococcoidia bacterium]
MREEQVAAYLQHTMPDAREIEVAQLWRIPGGASRETWSCDATWRDGKAHQGRGLIIRRDPEASLLETERHVEFRVYQALQNTGVPVPEVFWLETDPQWLERPFFVMGRLPGEASAQAIVGAPPEQREAVARQKVEILARIHNLDWSSGGLGLDFLGAPDGAQCCAEREIEHWERIMREQALESQPALELALAWLRAHRPVAQRITLVHADYRTGNFLVHGDRITGVLDWEMVHLGDPLEDVAWVCLRSWRWAGDARVGGLLPRDEFYRRYEKASGLKVDEDAVRFWEVLGNLKLAVIFLTGARSFSEGRSKDAVHAFTAHLNAEIEAEILSLID